MKRSQSDLESDGKVPTSYKRPLIDPLGTTVVSASMTNDRDATSFAYEPLLGSRQIRLLQITQQTSSDQAYLEFQTQVYTLEEVPKFAAISYTWGETEIVRDIVLDQKCFGVRKNCHEALSQVCRLWEDGFLDTALIWIDSICINQDDTAEKNVQVAMMGDVYGGAKEVLACVGPHLNDSEYLFSKIQETAGFRYNCEKCDLICDECQVPWTKWVLASGLQSIERLCTACAHFGERPYWSRLWIIQEIAKAKSILVLCGHDRMSWKVLNNVQDFLTMNIDEIDQVLQEFGTIPAYDRTPMYEVFRGRLQTVTVSDAFNRYSEAKCFLPRDHLYGILSLIRWAKNVPPILPDYDCTMLCLAVQVEAHISFEEIGAMLSTFRIDITEPNVQEELASRRKLREAGDTRALAGPDRLYKPLYSEGNALCGRIHAAQDGGLTAAFVKANQHDRSEDERFKAALPHLLRNLSASPSPETDGYVRRLLSHISSMFPEQNYRSLNVDGELVGATCGATAIGDILAPLHDPPDEVYVVLRLKHDDIYDIIGQALIRNEYRLISVPDSSADGSFLATFSAQVDLKVAAEDAIVLFAGDTDHMEFEEHEWEDISETESSVSSEGVEGDEGEVIHWDESQTQDRSLEADDVDSVDVHRWSRIFTPITQAPSGTASIAVQDNQPPSQEQADIQHDVSGDELEEFIAFIKNRTGSERGRIGRSSRRPHTLH